jgi:O-antigen/teichoic acid export membrane protein
MPAREPEPPPPRLKLTPRRGPASDRRGMLANSAYSLVAQISSGIFTAAITLYLVRALVPAQYGDYALAVGVGALIATPADFGVSSSTARFVARHRTDPQGLAAILADAVRLKLIASALACGALAILAGPIAGAYHAPLTWPLRLIAVAVLGQNLMFLFEASFIAARQVGPYVRVVVGESAMECGSTVLIVLLGGGLVGATVGRAIGYAFGATLALLSGAKMFHWPAALRRRGRASLIGRIARYAAPLMLVDGANALFTTVDILLIGAYLGSRQAGLFSAPTRLLALFFYPGIAISNGIAPRMARSSDGEPDGAALAAGVRGLTLFYAMLLAPLVIWAKPIVHIALGGSYGGSVETMQVLSLSVLLGGLAPLVSVSANYLGDVRRRVPLMIGATLLDAAIDVVLIPRIGIVSGAIATAAAYGVMLAGHLVICSRHVKLPFAQLAVTAARALLAAAAMGLVLALWGSDPSIPIMIVGAITGAVVFLLALVLLGELSRRELTQAWLWVRSRGSRTGPDN